MTHARTERAALCDLLDDLGPGAPTLCEGWATQDLAAHLVLRERRLDAAPGIALPLLAGHTAAVQERLTLRHSYPELVGLVRNGPPRWTPYGLVPALDAVVNTVELFVHHEDVRRAQPGWEPRELPEDLQETFWRRLRGGARFFMRGAPVGVVLRRPDGARTAGRMAEPAVVVTGEPAELLLFAFGRQEHARVTFQGDDQAVARLRQARFGL
ncbi:TIGR03085 family metal-binding protein [Microbispora amethystogenes]|uniref:TIGR03085 family protein n=1 Tax=Microbispora amethystogenes TaxID=1427754 RepID=A0ABQ4F646_9ACTN|nr:TIGR03085 family metal-binding protein [Microbispora amethystogenes]GIH30284.1 TIGR03085 family protein [Microbispora amethystogenes]